MNTIPPLRIIATYYDAFWSRQHFKGYTSGRRYCAVDDRIYTFAGEPECPVRTDVDILEVDASGNVIKKWQEAG